MKLAQYEQAKERIPKAVDLIISGMSVPEISPKYLLRQILNQPPKYCYT